MPEADLGMEIESMRLCLQAIQAMGNKQLITESDMLEEMEAQGRKSEEGVIYNINLVL